MALLRWADKFSVNIKNIDDQHKKLISMVNEFYSQISKKSEKAENNILEDLLNGLTEYTIYHFDTEEKYMMDTNYPDIDSHKKEHAEFVEKIRGIKNRYESGDVVLSIEITTFIKNWLVTHIMDTDQKFAQ